MRFVPVKTAEQQAALMLVGVRDRLIRNRTQLANAIRGYAAEFGLTAAKGRLTSILCSSAPKPMRACPPWLGSCSRPRPRNMRNCRRKLTKSMPGSCPDSAVDEFSRRLAKIPGVGPIGAVLLKMKTPEPELFRSGRQFAAWIGLTPKDHSTAGKVRLGVITRAGDEGLRSVLVVGATAVIQHVRRGGRSSPWLTELLKRKSPKLAAVALANKMARIAWKLMVTGENFAAKSTPAASAGVA